MCNELSAVVRAVQITWKTSRQRAGTGVGSGNRTDRQPIVAALVPEPAGFTAESASKPSLLRTYSVGASVGAASSSVSVPGAESDMSKGVGAGVDVSGRARKKPRPGANATGQWMTSSRQGVGAAVDVSGRPRKKPRPGANATGQWMTSSRKGTGAGVDVSGTMTPQLGHSNVFSVSNFASASDVVSVASKGGVVGELLADPDGGTRTTPSVEDSSGAARAGAADIVNVS